MMEPGREFIRQVESLGQGLAGGGGVFAVPGLGSWLTSRCCQAYHGGFVAPLVHDPRRAVLDLVAEDRRASRLHLAPPPLNERPLVSSTA